MDVKKCDSCGTVMAAAAHERIVVTLGYGISADACTAACAGTVAGQLLAELARRNTPQVPTPETVPAEVPS